MLTDDASAARSVSRPTVICFRAMIFGSSAAEVRKHGLASGLEPPDPVEADPVTIPEAEREQRGIRRLPATRHEPLDVLEADAIQTDALGSDGLVRRMGMHCGVAVPPVHWPEPARVAGFGRGGTGHRRDEHGAAADERRVGR
jgi:Glutamine synthetase, catalytic domain